MIRTNRLVVGALAVLLAACNSSTGTDTIASDMDKEAGDGQEALVNSQLPEPLVVRVTDRNGGAVEGVLVNWRVLTGGGSITGSSRTSSSGLAEAVFTLGPDEGQQGAEASISGLDVDPVVFTATATEPDDGGGGGGGNL